MGAVPCGFERLSCQEAAATTKHPPAPGRPVELDRPAMRNDGNTGGQEAAGRVCVLPLTKPRPKPALMNS